MADAIVRASVVPSGGNSAPIATLVAALAGASQALDTVTADPGGDLVVSADIVHSEAADADGVTSAAAVNDAIAEVGDCVLVGPIVVEADPLLSAPSDAAIDISDADFADIVYTYTVSNQNVSLVSIGLVSTDLDGVSVPYSVIHGDPQGHASQVSSEARFVIRVGPAPSGAEVGSPHDLVVTITDSLGRTAADTVAVAVTA